MPLASWNGMKTLYRTTDFQIIVKDEDEENDIFIANWNKDFAHQKIAYSRDRSNPVICFGDANHVAIHVHHAGFVVCSNFILTIT